MVFRTLSTSRLTSPYWPLLNSLFMGDDDRKPRISALPLRAWLASQGRGAAAALAKKLGYDHGRLSNWWRRGIPDGEVYAVALEMGITYEQYLTRAGALPDNAEP